MVRIILVQLLKRPTAIPLNCSKLWGMVKFSALIKLPFLRGNYKRKTALICVCYEYIHSSNRDWKRRLILERVTNLRVGLACDTRRPRRSVSHEQRLIFSKKNTVWQSRPKKNEPTTSHFNIKKMDLPTYFNSFDSDHWAGEKTLKSLLKLLS